MAKQTNKPNPEPLEEREELSPQEALEVAKKEAYDLGHKVGYDLGYKAGQKRLRRTIINQ